MAVTITAADVKAVQPTTLPDSVIDDIIATLDQADACLDANSVPDATQRLLKLYGAAHMVYGTAKGNVQSERSPTGASRTYREGGSGLDSSPWGSQVLQFDEYGCVTSLLQRDSTTYIASTGPGGRKGNIYPRSGRRRSWW